MFGLPGTIISYFAWYSCHSSVPFCNPSEIPAVAGKGHTVLLKDNFEIIHMYH